jgi:hypothetical protein
MLRPRDSNFRSRSISEREPRTSHGLRPKRPPCPRRRHIPRLLTCGTCGTTCRAPPRSPPRADYMLRDGLLRGRTRAPSARKTMQPMARRHSALSRRFVHLVTPMSHPYQQ